MNRRSSPSLERVRLVRVGSSAHRRLRRADEDYEAPPWNSCVKTSTLFFMRFSQCVLALALSVVCIPTTLGYSADFLLPQTPDTSRDSGEPYVATLIPPFSETRSGATEPVRLQIPRIKLNAPVQKVGVNEKGEMDVPSGKSGNVGWYAYGTKPGDVGSAVMDAHVYAAFAKLKNVKEGDHVYVTTESGEKLDFLVWGTATYKLEDVPREFLFAKNDAERLHLITCAGKYLSSSGTYSHRLIVYATLVE